jgi:glycosyltransferase involved in cell wall biosynthesis
MRTENNKVSVSLITYNQADFIEQAINSVLMQETDFKYELIIGEDQSSDGTREIVLAYQDKFPDRIKVLLNNRDEVIIIDGKPTGRWNLINNLRHCTGEYIALLEGDDYWTDPKKLQKQVDYLDQNPDHSMCFHKVLFAYENNDQSMKVYEPYQKKKSYNLEDLIQRNFIATLSVLYRNYPIFSCLPEWYYSVPIGDYPLHILTAENGNIGYLDEQMGIRRIHKGGFWSSMSAVEMQETATKVRDAISSYFSDSELSKVAQSSQYYDRYILDYLRLKRYSSLKNLIKCLYLVPNHMAVHERGLIRSFVDILLPMWFRNWAGKLIKNRMPK